MATHYIGLRTRAGGVSGPWEVSPGETPYELILAEAPDITPDTGSSRERTHVVFGGSTTWRTLAKVALVRPRGLYEVEIEAVTEDPSVHRAEDGVTAPPIRISRLPRKVTAPKVTGLIGIRAIDDPTRALVAWQPAPGAEIYEIEVAEGADPSDPDVSWARVADTTSAHYLILLLWADRTMVRVRGVGLVAGPWAYAVLGDLVPGMWTDSGALKWSATSSDPMCS